MENIPEEPKKSQKRGQSKEHMAEISKIGNEIKKKQGAITAYEKAQKRKEIEEKFAMIQNEISKQNSPIQHDQPETISVKQERPPPKNKKPKKIIEVVEEVDDESDEESEEEEVVIKKIVKKKPTRIAHNRYQDQPEEQAKAESRHEEATDGIII